MQVDNHYLPPYRREDVSSFIVIGGCPNAARVVAPQRFIAHTNPVTQHKVYNEPLPLVEGSRGTMHQTFGVGANRGLCQGLGELVALNFTSHIWK